MKFIQLQRRHGIGKFTSLAIDIFYKYLLDELSDVNFKPGSTTINKSFIWGAVMINPFVAIIAQILIAIMQFHSQQETCLFKATIIFNVVE